MAKIELAPGVGEDLDRILDHLERHQIADVDERVRGIIDAFAILENNPLIGRPARADNRELVIGRRSRGYVALYRYVPGLDTVFVLSIRSQREAGYDR